MQDYKSLCAAVMICATLVNIQTHSCTISSASYAKNRLHCRVRAEYCEVQKDFSITTAIMISLVLTECTAEANHLGVLLVTHRHTAAVPYPWS